jgi:transcription antitermination factor NusG
MEPWYVVLTGSQQEITTVWRLHLLGIEMFTPVLRRRIRTGRVHRGRQITRLVVRPMFPSYGFVRQGDADTDAILGVHGVRDFLRNERDDPVTLPHEAVLAIYDKQQQELDEFITASRRGRYFASNLKPGQSVRVDDGGIYSGLVASVDRVDARGRVEVLFGMIRHTLPIDMVAAV